MQLKEVSLNELTQIIERVVRKVLTESTPAAAPDVNKIYTRKEAAQLLGVTLTTLYQWDLNGILPAQRLGKKVFYSAANINAFFTTRPEIKNKVKRY